MLIRNRIFGGERPKRGERNLEPHEAVLALDCELGSHELRALFGASVEEEGISANTQTIVNFNEKWFGFDDQRDVVEYGDRLFMTGPAGSRQATYAQLLGSTSYKMGVPTPDAPTAVESGTGTGTAFDTFWAVTFVNQFGEEGDKSDVSDTITTQPGNTITIGNIGISNQLDAPTATDSGVTRQRIYRLSEGALKFVVELPATTTSYVETVGDTLAESFSTEDFAPPPSGLIGLHLMANGIALGYVASERAVYVSEQGNLNAWPYFFPVESAPVGISSYDNNAVILTEGFPEVAAITDPRNIVPTVLTYREPCQSKLSIVQSEGGVMYASVNGIFYIGRGGGKLLTDEHLDQSDWRRYVPTSMKSLYKDGQYIGFHSGTTVGNAVVLDTREPLAILRQLSQRADATFVKPGTDKAFVAYNSQILELEGSEFKLEYTYTSKLFGEGTPFSLTSRRVLLCEQIDRNRNELTDTEIAALYAARAAQLTALSALDGLHGFGGAINQNAIGGAGLWVLPGSTLSFDIGTSIGGGHESDLPFITNYSIVLNLFGDKELVHTEVITDDENDGRITYHDRRRLYQFQLVGELDVSSVEIAGSNSEMF